jgi:hypothetical protein
MGKSTNGVYMNHYPQRMVKCLLHLKAPHEAFLKYGEKAGRLFRFQFGRVILLYAVAVSQWAKSGRILSCWVSLLMVREYSKLSQICQAKLMQVGTLRPVALSD